MSELTGGDTTIPRDSQDAVPARTTVPPGPASEGLSKAGIAAMQGIDLPEPIKPEEWNTRPEPAIEQLKPELYTDPTVENPDEIFADSDSSTLPSEGPVESPVSHRG